MNTILPIALQMYTVRDAAARDFARTLRHVRETGYENIELAGTHNMAADALRDYLKEIGLTVVSAHVPLEALEGGLDEVLPFYNTLGVPFLVIPYLPEPRRRDETGYRDLGATLNRIGSSVRGAGMQLAYHNHDFEFQKFDPTGEMGMDILLRGTDPELVKIELDTFWVKKAGLDPAAYLRQYPGRTPLIHLKDMTGDERATFAEVGEGVMDFPAIFGAAQEAGAKYYIVEQDRCERDPLESIRISLDNLAGMGMVPGQSQTTEGSRPKDGGSDSANDQGRGGGHHGTSPAGQGH